MKKSTLVLIGTVAVLAVALVTVIIVATSLNRQKKIAEANIKAAHDTTRVHLVDSTMAISRLLHQADIDADSLEGALAAALEDRNASVRAVTAIQVSFDSVLKENVKLKGDIVTLSRAGEAYRIVQIDVEPPPVLVDIDVSVPLDTLKETEIEYSNIEVSPFVARYAIGCNEEDGAVVSMETPDWVHLTLKSGTVDPDVCIPPVYSNLAMDLFLPTWGKGLWGIGGFVLGWFAKGATTSTDVNVSLLSVRF